MSFSADITAFVKKAQGRADRVVKKVVIDLGTSVIKKTPVGDPAYWQGSYYDLYTKTGKRRKKPKLVTPSKPDGYVGGTARANWQYGNGVMPSGIIDDTDKSGNKTIAALTSGVKTSDGASVHWIASSLPYINALENGWSRQAPNGMVGLTVTEFQQIVKRAANERT
jgi:hypothetical protein